MKWTVQANIMSSSTHKDNKKTSSESLVFIHSANNFEHFFLKKIWKVRNLWKDPNNSAKLLFQKDLSTKHEKKNETKTSDWIYMQNAD